MPSRKRRVAGALLAVASGLALSAQSPAPHAAPAAAGQHGPGPYGRGGKPAHPHSGSYRPYPGVIIFGSANGTPAPASSPKHRATPRPADAPEVFESHSTAQ